MISSYELARLEEFLKAKKEYDAAKKRLEDKQEILDKTFRSVKLPLRILVNNEMVIIARNKAAKCVQVHYLPIDGVFKDGNAVTVHKNYTDEKLNKGFKL